MSKRAVLITQTLGQEERDFLQDSEISFREVPFIAVDLLDFTLGDFIPRYLVLMSQNAITSILKKEPDLLRRYPILCVGRKTAELARSLGGKVRLEADYAADLLFQIEHKKLNDLLILSGNRETAGVAEWRSKTTLNYQKIIVYETRLTPQKIDFPFAAVVFFSPSAVLSFSQDNDFREKECFCLGKTTAAALPPGVHSALPPHPTKMATLKLCVASIKGKENDPKRLQH